MIKISGMGFSINRYDDSGDIWEEGIYLHIDDNTSFKIGKTINDFDRFVTKVKSMRTEIEENLQY